jgi:hypothetical protein
VASTKAIFLASLLQEPRFFCRHHHKPLESGKVAEEWQIFDALGMMQQLGAIPSPGEAQA